MGTDRARRALPAITALVLCAMAVGARAWIATLPARWSLESYDRFLIFTPFQVRLGNALAQGRIPLWNPLLGLGIYEAADPNLSPLYPPNLLFGLFSVARAEELLTVGHIMLAAMGGFLLARRCSLGLAGAAVTGAVLLSANTLHSLASWTSMLATFAWTPLALLLARRLADRPSATRAVELSGVLALQILAGYLQLHLYTVLCLPLFFLPVARWSGLARPLGWAVVAELVAIGLAAFFLLPAMLEIAGSWRSRGAVPEILHHIFPIRLADYPAGLASPDPAPGPRVFAGPLFVPLVLAGVLARGVAPRLRLPALSLTAITVVLSLGDTTPIYPALRELPISHWLTGPYKWTFLAALGAMLLAGVGTHALLAPAPARPFAERLWALVALLCLLGLPLDLEGWMVGVAGVLALLAVRHTASTRLRVATGAALPILVAVSALAAHGERAVTPADAPSVFERRRPAFAYLARRQNYGRMFLSIPGATVSPREGEMEGVAQINTNGVTVSVRLARFLQAVQEPLRRRDARQALPRLRALGVRFIMTPSNIQPGLRAARLRRVFQSPGADVWEDEAALPRVYVARAVEHLPAERVLERLGDRAVAATRTAVLEAEEGESGTGARGSARIEHATDTEVVVKVFAASAGVLVLLDAWSPQWRAWVDGRPAVIRRANWLARAVAVPAGRHEVVFRFVPVSLYVGLAISIATALGCVATVVVLRRRAQPSV